LPGPRRVEPRARSRFGALANEGSETAVGRSGRGEDVDGIGREDRPDRIGDGVFSSA
jgi:hypothetical protein